MNVCLTKFLTHFLSSQLTESNLNSEQVEKEGLYHIKIDIFSRRAFCSQMRVPFQSKNLNRIAD
ncbi:hypothetical protein TTHERM_00622730 (macronuclear) [Tetrahymena thermophila SB210]|uniref:Uncharacterized protein n=1 Tax=Tetrahymena thermophila (strain SB210) TaxID=312017 RepID=Q241B1_TETTS|nr:hypothetical protein TTHERM_00622730 [Tetrahymena thermophila SB210]EAS02253.1 hypothetical protein TTHERM_00622730 [Tetrahymena thermophila SB210]|eukprot:XP_001022498.1 hypothetical protein TTHERM_00622730 [Tetrahymena thermophila SB210]